MALPILLPQKSIPPSLRQGSKENQRENPFGHLEWKPKRYLSEPQPPSNEDSRLQEDFIAKQALEGKIVKKTRPRRTVDYNGGMGRWILNRKLRPNPGYVPYMRPAPPYVIDLLPPKAYPDNASTSLCTKFVHTSTNKIRCPVNVVTWTPEARRILTGSTSGEFTLWNGLTFNFETILQAHDTAITAMRFTHSGHYLASTDKSGVIKYFEPNMNNLTAWQGTNSGNREAIRGLSFSPDDQRFVTASDDASLRIWSFKESRGESVLSGHGWDVKCVEWHPTKGLIVSGSKDSSVKFWDPRTGTCLSTLHNHKNTIQAMAWSPNGNQLATGSRDQTVRVFDIRAMKEFSILKGHKKEVCSLAWHPVHPLIVSGGSEGSILHWDLSSADMVDSISVPSAATAPATANQRPGASGKGRIARGGAGASALPLFTGTVPTTTPRATLSQAHDSNVWALTYHPLGHILVSGSNDHTTRFWSRERPGDERSSFSAGGEKPPEEMGGDGGEDDEDMGGMSVPGFGFGFASGGLPGFGASTTATAGPGSGSPEKAERSSSGRDISGGWWREPAVENTSGRERERERERDGGPSSSNYESSSRSGAATASGGDRGGIQSNSTDEYAIPGFGGSALPSSGGGGYDNAQSSDNRRGNGGYDRDREFGRGDDYGGGGGGGAGGDGQYSGYGNNNNHSGGGDDWDNGGGGRGRGGRDDWGGGGAGAGGGSRNNHGHGGGRGQDGRYGGGGGGGGRRGRY
ncbi:WD40 repeat-like protein [Coprinopsis marcescibilis]|uniref:Polyadenylation factor subunit 2 n=1 Tax=Coprinopsis marcescibilis TaxID=230819 RepID=A0A5C3KQI8_COPMA|nr:WD40 repeat-like protein [Coprinopsis marcescibilis]